MLIYLLFTLLNKNKMKQIIMIYLILIHILFLKKITKKISLLNNIKVEYLVLSIFCSDLYF